MNHGLAVIPKHWAWNAVFLDWGDAGGLGIVRTISELRLIYGGACIHLGYCPIDIGQVLTKKIWTNGSLPQ